MNTDLRMPTATRADGWAWARDTAHAVARSSVDPRELLDALDHFEKILGGDWPGWAEGRPLANAFFTAVNGARSSGVEFHHALALLHDDPDIGEVIGQLQSAAWEQFVAASMVLELASRAARAGITAKFLRARGKRIADLRLQVDRRWLTVECVALHESAVMRQAEQVDVALSRWLASSGVNRLGRTTVTALNDIAPSAVLERWPELTDSIQQLVLEDRSEVVLDGFAKIAFERGLAPLPVAVSGLGGEPIDTDIRRLQHRMRQKSRQLATEGPSILVARSRFMFSFECAREEMLLRTLAMTNDEHARLTDIGASLVYETWLGSPPPARSRRAGGFAILEGNDDRGRSRVAAYVANPNATYPLSDAEVEAFIGRNAFW